jgi:hypothetical protein
MTTILDSKNLCFYKILDKFLFFLIKYVINIYGVLQK